MPLSEWQASAYSSVDGHRFEFNGRAYADGPSCRVDRLAGGPAAVVLEFYAPVDGIVVHGLGEDGASIASAATDGPRERLVLRVEDASLLAAVVLQHARPGPAEVQFKSGSIVRLDPDFSIARAFRPTALERPHWNAKAYGVPGDGDEDVLRWLAWSSMKEPTAVPWWSGTRLFLYPGESLSRAIAQTGAYEPETAIPLKRMLPRGGVFIDAGANSGVFSLPASHWVGSDGLVVAVEPSSRELEKLRANIELNAARNIRVVEAALAAAIGDGRLLVADGANAGLNTLGPTLAHGAEPIDAVSVPVTTLDRLCEDLGLERLDVLKADVEGGELELLLGGRTAIKRFRPALILEVEVTALDPMGHDVGELENLLEELEYRMFALEEPDQPPRALDYLAGVAHGNVLAIPSERSAAFEQRSDKAREAAAQKQLLERIAGMGTAMGAAHKEAEAALESQLRAAKLEGALAATQAENERLQQELIQTTQRLDEAVTARERLQQELSVTIQRLEEAATNRDASLAEAAAQAAALEEARHNLHQLESRVRQYQSELADLERELERARSVAEAAQAGREAADRELEATLALHAREDAARDERIAATLTALNTRHVQALADAEAARREAEAAADAQRRKLEAELDAARERVRLAEQRREAEAGMLQAGLDNARDQVRSAWEELQTRNRELEDERRWSAHLDQELHDRNQLLAAARRAPFRFALKRSQIWLARRIVRPLKPKPATS